MPFCVNYQLRIIISFCICMTFINNTKFDGKDRLNFIFKSEIFLLILIQIFLCSINMCAYSVVFSPMNFKASQASRGQETF